MLFSEVLVRVPEALSALEESSSDPSQSYVEHCIVESLCGMCAELFGTV